MGPTGPFKKPIGVLCLASGRALETWPNEDPMKVLERSKTDDKLKAEIKDVRELLQIAVNQPGYPVQPFKLSDVDYSRAVGLRLETTAWFVKFKQFSLKYKKPPESLIEKGLKLIC